MRKILVLMLAALFAVSSVSFAEAAKKKTKRAKGKPAAAKTVNTNEASGRLVVDGLSQVFVPFKSLAGEPVKAKKKATKKKKKK